MKATFGPISICFLLAPFFMKLLKADLLIHKLFSRTLDCDGGSGCALDEPNGILEGMPSRLRCAAKCLARDCVNFNYLEESGSCLIFGTTPYMITNNTLCSSYDNTIQGGKGYPGENLSKHRRACQPTNNVVNDMILAPWLALDDLNGTLIPSGHCSHTKTNDSYDNWFIVDLVHYVTISHVNILGRETRSLSVTLRYKNLTIGVTNDSWLIRKPVRHQYALCGVYQGPPVNTSWFTIFCQPSIPKARYVVVYQTQLNSTNGGFLSLCEFQVFGTF